MQIDDKFLITGPSALVRSNAASNKLAVLRPPPTLGSDVRNAASRGRFCPESLVMVGFGYAHVRMGRSSLSLSKLKPRSVWTRRRLGQSLLALGAGTFLPGCRKSSAHSAQQAVEHVKLLKKAIRADVEEVNNGLPRGAELLTEYVATESLEDASALGTALEKTRNKIQDLRSCKATFFALTDPSSLVLRSDQRPDLLAGRSLNEAFPELQRVFAGASVRTRGKIQQAATVPRPDAQWLAAEPIRVGGQIKGAYVAGWSWSGYAYRLENQLRSAVRSTVTPPDKEPLLYVYVLVEDQAFFAKVSPEVTGRELVALRLFDQAKADAIVTAEREITGRDFGIAFARTPELGENVGIAVVRSET
jgi:hypothetical protein